MARRRPRSVCASAFSVESLEVRALPSVTATLASGVLTLQGDQSANEIRLEQIGDALAITGENGTLIRFKGEDVNTLSLTGVQSLRGSFGQNADVVKFQNEVTLNGVTLNLGGGSNEVEFREASVTGKVTITGGSDGDRVKFDAGTFRQVTLNLIDGDDAVEFHGSTVEGLLSINTGNGLDAVKANEGLGGDGNTFSGAVTIKTGNQADDIELRNSIFENLTIDTGADNDEIELETVTVNGRLNVNGNAGDDEMTFRALVQTGAGTNSIVGLSGQDDVAIDGAVFGSAVSINMGPGPGNVLEVDDVEFKKAVTIISTGPNDRLRIEQNPTSMAATKFFGVVEIQMGPGGVINLGADQDASYTESHGLVTVKGSKPNVLINIVLPKVEFTQPPILKNAEYVLAPVV